MESKFYYFQISQYLIHYYQNCIAIKIYSLYKSWIHFWNWWKITFQKRISSRAELEKWRSKSICFLIWSEITLLIGIMLRLQPEQSRCCYAEEQLCQRLPLRRIWRWWRKRGWISRRRKPLHWWRVSTLWSRSCLYTI